jgi:nucleotide-binding universal stress UspA family protein
VAGLPIVTDVMRGRPDEALVKRAGELGATLIVIGAVGTGQSIVGCWAVARTLRPVKPRCPYW